jgi:hypothetical protein
MPNIPQLAVSVDTNHLPKLKILCDEPKPVAVLQDHTPSLENNRPAHNRLPNTQNCKQRPQEHATH